MWLFTFMTFVIVTMTSGQSLTCSYGDVMYYPGEVKLDACVTCLCSGETGQLTCAHETCPATDDPTCIKYEIPVGECCAVCVETGCIYNGVAYPRGQKVSVGSCQYCYCPWSGIGALIGEVTCVNVTCLDMGCPGAITPPGRCCPVCPGSYLDEWTEHFGYDDDIIPYYGHE